MHFSFGRLPSARCNPVDSSPSFPPSLLSHRFALVWLAIAAICATAFATRAVLAVRAVNAGQFDFTDIPRAFVAGFGYDLITALYVTAALTVYLLLVPEKMYRWRWHRKVLAALSALSIFGLLYLGAVEYFFFDEFNARFNFVAVEYLIYPHEVFVNIWQSYPVGRTLAVMALITLVAVIALRRPATTALTAVTPLRHRAAHAALLLAPLVLAHVLVDTNTWRTHGNRVADEVSSNGIYAFFSAATNAHLDYPQYYTTVNASEAVSRARALVAQPNAEFLPDAPHPLARRVTYAGAARPLHVIVLLEESLGAEFVGEYGGKSGLTPNLDRLANESLVFKRVYATGTRTVRGMEAVTASFPPLPPDAIVKRSRNEGMFNWSTVMRENGYSPTFIYGGYGTFDNMNYFFAHNGYRVIDRTDMPTPAFANIWGMSDVDLFGNALRTFDDQHQRGERIFSVVMTTSNHKPFTFPENVPGVKPRGGGRDAGVRYADHAIGWFIDELKKKPYFDDTMVVIVADHGARAYGRASIPLPTYEIPFLVYSPKHIAPRRVEHLVSQLDVAPTVLGLLNLSHESRFFGKDALIGDDRSRFAVLNHNRDIAVLRNEQLAQIGFGKTRAMVAWDPARRELARLSEDDNALRDTEALFQVAYDVYTKRLPPMPAAVAAVQPR